MISLIALFFNLAVQPASADHHYAGEHFINTNIEIRKPDLDISKWTHEEKVYVSRQKRLNRESSDIEKRSKALEFVTQFRGKQLAKEFCSAQGYEYLSAFYWGMEPTTSGLKHKVKNIVCSNQEPKSTKRDGPVLEGNDDYGRSLIADHLGKKSHIKGNYTHVNPARYKLTDMRAKTDHIKEPTKNGNDGMSVTLKRITAKR